MSENETQIEASARPAVRSETWLGHCRCCGSNAEVRHVNLYVYGSEGLTVCHRCEMSILEYVRQLSSIAGRARMAGYKAAKETKPVETAVA